MLRKLGKGNGNGRRLPQAWLGVCLQVVALGITVCSSMVAFAADLGPGCAPNRPAVSHHAVGVSVQAPKGEKAPIPCATATGWRSSEVSIVVTDSGTILFQPAVPPAGFPIAVLRSADLGETWEHILPSQYNDPPRITAVDQNMRIERSTGRAFWLIGEPGGTDQEPRLDISDDDGRSWFKATQPPLPLDHSQIFNGPPTKRAMVPGNGSVVYVCQGHQPQTCQESFDGGITFGPGVALPFPPKLECAGGNYDFGLRGVVSRDGTVFVPFAPCNRPYIAISHDEGNSWQLVNVAHTITLGFGEMPLGEDKDGNLYAAWVGSQDRLPYLSISRDHGLNWSTPSMIGAPGVNEAAIPQLVAGAGGQVALTYYGSTNAPKPFPPACSSFSLDCPGYTQETWSTYITETWDALAQNPLFWSATLNDPTQPTWYGCSPSAISLQSLNATSGCLGFTNPAAPYWGRLDYYGATMARDGTAWVGFDQECPGGLPVSGNPNCPGNLKGTGPDSLFGFVGRLVKVR